MQLLSKRERLRWLQELVDVAGKLTSVVTDPRVGAPCLPLVHPVPTCGLAQPQIPWPPCVHAVLCCALHWLLCTWLCVLADPHASACTCHRSSRL